MNAREAFASEYSVPRETLVAFDRYANMLIDWQGRMNLVGPATLPDVWTRHFADSAQLNALAAPGQWLDIGAGGGFPGIVVALLGAGPVHLVESILKKCQFLQAVIDELGLVERAVVHRVRVETMPRFAAATITARAAAALERLFDWGLRFATPDTRWLLPKGASVESELTAARMRFTFDFELVPSRTHPDGRIVVARNVRRR